MIQRELLGTAQVPGGEVLRLYRHDKDHMIVLDHNELMSTRKWGSEEALATQAIERLSHTPSPHLLIGGYGMGFTLRSALAQLGPKAKVCVVELMPQIIEWARGPMAELTAACLDDPRVTLEMADVSDAITGAKGRYDAILLDVDNGPDGLVREGNDAIYTRAGLLSAKAALRKGGVLAIWSATPAPSFTRRLIRAKFHVEEIKVAARSNGKGPKHVIWFASPR